MRWLLEILHTEYVDLVRHTYAGKRDPRLEENLRDAVDESSAGLEKILAAPESTPSERVEKMERELRVAGALEKLPENQRDVIILFHYQEKTIAEIANQLDRTEDSVSGLLDRGRKKLREILKDDAP
jgi:RNA polymerase sigma-70 factor (ECF subfamily)